MTQMYHQLGPILCKALPGFHAFTGTDYSAAFSRRGKVTPFKKLQKNLSAQKAFGNLGKEERVSEHDMASIEKFVCAMYGFPQLSLIDAVRLEIFLRKYKVNTKQTNLFAKKLQSYSFPPCQRVLIEKIKRANFIAAKWISSTRPVMPPFNPTNCGWCLENGMYAIHWYSGPAEPAIIDVTITEETADADNITDDDLENDMSHSGSDSEDELNCFPPF